MSEQRLKVESGPPQHMIADGPADISPQPDGPPKSEQIKETAQDVAGPAKDKAREVAGQARSQAQEAAGQAKQQAAAQVDEKSTQVGQQIGSQADALQGVAGELRNQGKDGAANAAEQAAEKVKNVGDYLEQADGEKLVETAQQVARDNPAAAAAVGAAAGFAAGRVIKAALDNDDPQPGTSDAAVTDPVQPGTGTS